MKRIALIACTVVGLALGSSQARAGWGSIGYSGYQPWWNIFAKRYKCLTPEEERLQKFWHDYYDAMKHFYADLDHIDWVAYYKNHGYQINGGCGGGGGCCGRINYAPVFITPGYQWAVPSNCAGAPTGPGCMGGPMMGGMPMDGMPMAGGMPMGGYPMAGMQQPGMPMTMPANMQGGMPMPHPGSY
jgi:hypothetical protein